MFDHLHPTSLLAKADPAASFREFAASHREGLLNAAGLLGGRRGVRLALAVLDDLASNRSLTRRTWMQTTALLEILSLERVQDSESEECARFAAINPCDPVVEEICALTDGLREALERVNTDHRPVSRGVSA